MAPLFLFLLMFLPGYSNMGIEMVSIGSIGIAIGTATTMLAIIIIIIIIIQDRCWPHCFDIIGADMRITLEKRMIMTTTTMMMTMMT